MAANAAAAMFMADLIEDNYYRERNDSALCLWLRFQEEGPLGGNPAAGFMRRQLCEPTPPPPPPPEEFFNAGGVPCRQYIVTFETGEPGGPGTISQVTLNGPIGRLQVVRNDPGGAVNKQIYVTSGDGLGCPRVFDVMAGTSNATIVDVFARIISIVPVTPDPATEIPVYGPPLAPPDEPQPPQPFEFTYNFDGVEIEANVELGPIINTDFGPVIQIGFNPTANFNPPINPTLGSDPKFGIDLNFEFVIELGGPPGFPAPAPGAEPIPLPGLDPDRGSGGEPFDYERIEKKIEDESCCKPVSESEVIGTFVFETTGDVYNAAIPDNAEFITIDVVPDNNSRRYKLAGDDSEIALGNASITSNGKALGYEKVFVRRHVLKVPPNLPDGGIRVSLKQGCSITVGALLHAV